jgi:hypothetical protein
MPSFVEIQVRAPQATALQEYGAPVLVGLVSGTHLGDD